MSTLLTIAAVTGAFSIAGVITLLVTYLYGKGYRWQAPIQWLSYDVDTGEWVRSKELKRRHAAAAEELARKSRAADVERDIASLHEFIFQDPAEELRYHENAAREAFVRQANCRHESTETMVNGLGSPIMSWCNDCNASRPVENR